MTSASSPAAVARPHNFTCFRGAVADVGGPLPFSPNRELSPLDARIINLSLGSSNGSQTLHDAVAYAYGKGATIVAAAGNNGGNTVSFPAAYDNYVIAVSATRFDALRTAAVASTIP